MAEYFSESCHSMCNDSSLNILPTKLHRHSSGNSLPAYDDDLNKVVDMVCEGTNPSTSGDSSSLSLPQKLADNELLTKIAHLKEKRQLN